MTEDWRSGGFGLYLHWPFCQAKCPYCDFNSHVREEIDQSRWLRAYLGEIDRYADAFPGRVLNSIFIGGGTPSLMQPDVVGELLSSIRKKWTVANDLEVTLEANPTSVEAGRFSAYAEGGVNRLSLGVQSLRDDDLKRLGRLHTSKESIQAFDIARKIFDRVSFDLMYARQDQSLEDWRAELSEALLLAVDHLSLYQLTLEPGTVFSERFARGGLQGLPSDDLAADMYVLTHELCEEAGFRAYEVSNYAKQGAESRHNLIYWRYGDYIGIGPGAHGRVTIDGARYQTEAYSNPERWLEFANIGKTEKVFEPISQSDQATEFLLMGLRLEEGISLQRYESLARNPLPEKRIQHLVEHGLIETCEAQLKATANGRLVLNSVIAELLPD